MVKNKLWCMGLALAFTLPCFAKKPILLLGQWDRDARSIIPQLPIQAWIEDNNKSLLLEFSSFLGTIEVIVTNSAGDVMYKQSVDTKVTSSTIISLKEEVKQDDILLITDNRNIISGNLLPTN